VVELTVPDGNLAMPLESTIGTFIVALDAEQPATVCVMDADKQVLLSYSYDGHPFGRESQT
jgi:hypothetical protein